MMPYASSELIREVVTTENWAFHRISRILVVAKNREMVRSDMVVPKSTLLYGTETWTILGRHHQKLNAFHQRCLRSILKISWEDRIPNEEVLKKAKSTDITTMIQIRRLRWAGHVSRMSEARIAKQVAFGELSKGSRKQCKPKKRWSDVLKDDLKSLKINLNTWRYQAGDRNTWRTKIHQGSRQQHTEKQNETAQRRAERHEVEENDTWNCPLCDFTRPGRRGRQYVNSHITQSHKSQLAVTANAPQDLRCTICQFVSRSKAGFGSHYRSKHPGIENPFLQSIRPVREVHSRQSTDSISNHSTLSNEFTISTTSDVVCILCNRAFKSRAGLTSHRRDNTCGVMRGGGTSDR
ncbi:hypothetical protein M8J77_002254 [Diaphorina citri]|nr:hypothetical protein M8J77_002254 [Diaphorina citri]